MPILYAFQSRSLLRRLSEIEADATAIMTRAGQFSPDYYSAQSALGSAKMAREELLRTVLADVPVETVPAMAIAAE